MRPDTMFLLSTIGSMAIAMIVVAIVVYNISKYSCFEGARQNEVEVRWGVFAGCSYFHPTSHLWVPAQNYRAVGD